MHFYCTESYKSLAGFAGRDDDAYVLRWDTVPKIAFHVHPSYFPVDCRILF